MAMRGEVNLSVDLSSMISKLRESKQKKR